MIPSLLQIPSAVSDSKLHSVLPNNGKGDFQFERSTGATRINRDGLIEEVGYFSSELVQNGNFSELGSDVVLNGNFDNGSTNWTLIGDVSIGNGVCTFFDTGSNTNSRLIQSTITANKTYKVVFSVTRYVAGRVQLVFGGASAVNFDISAGVGTYTAYVTAGGSTQWEIKRDGGVPNFDFDIDNISVKQVDPNDRWILGTGYTYGDGVVNSSSSDGNFLTSSATLVVGKTYKVSFDVTRTSGELRHYNGGFTGITANATGTFSGVFTPTETILRFYSSAFVGSVDNVSVVEVQGDRPRLSYDITNGVVEDQPHLLLEPSATNSITFSNDLSQSVYTGDGFSNAVYGQVGVNGTNDAWLFTKSGASNSDIYNTAFTGTYTFSFFVKKEANKGVKIYNFGDTTQNSTINIETGAYVAGVNTVTIQEFPNDWLRVAQTLTISNGKYYLYVTDGTSTQIASSIVVQYFQIEQQAFPTTYIPTAGTTITRAAETCNNSKPSVNSTEGVLYCEIASIANDQSEKRVTMSDGSIANRVAIEYTLTSNEIKGRVVNGSSTQANMNHTVSDITNFSKIAVNYKANDFQLWIDGNNVVTDTSGTTPATLNQISFDNGASGNYFYGKVKGLAVYNEALSESQLMQLTGVTASSIYSNFVTRTASFTVEALNEVKKVIDNL
tara:strand:+ start:167 stop:2173 length:2007 start_codon:yes stop_codon:yes gene_type:complete